MKATLKIVEWNHDGFEQILCSSGAQKVCEQIGNRFLQLMGLHELIGDALFFELGNWILRFLCGFAKFYIDLIRGTPLLLQVLIINFGIFSSIRI